MLLVWNPQEASVLGGGGLTVLQESLYGTVGGNQAPTAVLLSNTTVPNATDTTGGYIVGTLSFTDPDPGATGTFSIIGGADQANFTTDNPQDDWLLLLDDGVLDIGAQASYAVTVRFTDQGALTKDQAFTITVVAAGSPGGAMPGGVSASLHGGLAAADSRLIVLSF
jgi:hypothetical protein